MTAEHKPIVVRHLVVVGGGTAGWLAALMCQALLRAGKQAADPSSSVADVKVTVVESSRIPTIGVGEGTTAVFASILKNLGIDETSFLRETGATIKYGIKHRDWKRLNHSYDGPIDDPHAVVDLPRTVPWLDVAAVAAGKPVNQHRLFHYLLNLHRAPVASRGSGQHVPVGPFQHAYHFDQARVGAFLRAQAQGVEHIDATVQDVVRNSAGDITALISDAQEEITGDLFIDCTGFRRQLIGALEQDNWVSYRDVLPVNRAMPFWLPHKSNGDIPPYTEAWAQKHGWMWSIPTQERLGCGYVYCDDFTSPDAAQAEIEGVLGHAIEPRTDLRFNGGRLRNAWVNNCVALGLSSSFLEPLEATSIHGTVVQLLLLLQRHVHWSSDEGCQWVQAAEYNQTVASQLDDFREFINLHYVSERVDSEFWKHVAADCISEGNRERVARWQNTVPQPSDFRRLPLSLPHMEEPLYYPVLDGLGLLDAAAAKALLSDYPQHRSRARKDIRSLAAEYRKAATRAMDHRRFLGIDN